ncbi:MAG: hypothetical protein H6720_23610 [Sandaracinus sp.]|nr:hypothetical protein [Sandaracinus sp.]
MTRTLAFVALLALALTPPLDAQPRVTPEDVRVQAAAAVGELGWRAEPDAYAAIVEVHVRRARLRGVSPRTMARAYSAALRRPPRHRAWVTELRDAPSPPPSWPQHLRGRWAERRATFARVERIALEVLTGARDEVCPEALYYGSTADGPPGGDPTRWESACAFESTTQRWWRRVDERADGGET